MLPAEARTHLPLYGSTLSPVSSTACGAGGIGRAQDGADVAGVARVGQHRDQLRRPREHLSQAAGAARGRPRPAPAG